MTPIKKYVAIGPESTGKSTLCELLAGHYHTIWCREYAREYLERYGSHYQYHDLLAIAKGQLANEERAMQELRRSEQAFLFVDTDLQVLRVWSEYVFNDCDAFILNRIAETKCDGYFLCAPDLPWQPDPLREYPDQKKRNELFLYYKELLTAQSNPWVIIAGDYQQRLQSAIEFVTADSAA